MPSAADRDVLGRPSSLKGAAKPVLDRLYGRMRGNRLRAKQQRLLEITLPRLRFNEEFVNRPLQAFGASASELWLEVGFGGGEHARAQAAEHPHAALIAAEVYENGVCSMLSALVSSGDESTAVLPDNLRIWPADARTLLRALPSDSLDRLFLLFPDPWPKSRHAKRRFVHPDMIPLVAHVMRPGAEWRIASDDPTYQAWTQAVLDGQNFFSAAPPCRERPLGWASTRYEAKARAAGRQPLYWSAVRTGQEVSDELLVVPVPP